MANKEPWAPSQSPGMLLQALTLGWRWILGWKTREFQIWTQLHFHEVTQDKPQAIPQNLEPGLKPPPSLAARAGELFPGKNAFSSNPSSCGNFLTALSSSRHGETGAMQGRPPSWPEAIQILGQWGLASLEKAGWRENPISVFKCQPGTSVDEDKGQARMKSRRNFCP